MEHYDMALVCLNGHVINQYFKHYPEDNMDYCDKCGVKTTTICQHCETSIKGWPLDEDGPMISLISDSPDPPKAYCHGCGKPYPWTMRKLDAAKELTQELDGLNADEMAMLTKSLDDIIIDTPKTQVAVTRFKKFIKKARGDAVQAMRDLVVDIASETAVKMLKGP